MYYERNIVNQLLISIFHLILHIIWYLITNILNDDAIALFTFAFAFAFALAFMITSTFAFAFMFAAEIWSNQNTE